MKNWQYAFIGVVNGIYFIYYSAENNNLYAKVAGIGLLVLTAVPIFKIFAKLNVYHEVSEQIKTHGQRIKSLYALYKMAPTVLENQIAVEKMAQKMLLIDGRVEVWRRLAKNSVSEASMPQNIQAQDKKSHIIFLAHNERIEASLGRVVSQYGELRGASDRPTLIVTDIGITDITEKNLSDYLDGDLELDYWIGKKIIQGRDLIVVSGSIIEKDDSLVWSVIDKISDKYERVFVLVSEASVVALQNAQTPVGRRVLSMTNDFT